jgi:membrane associated rhomboid family serine protease
MILPVADESALRTPWLMLGLIGACVLGFLVAGGVSRIAGHDDVVQLEQAVDYWLEHPYLEPEPEVLEVAAAAAGFSDSAAFVANARKRGALPPADGEIFEHERAGLEDMTRLALRGTDAAPGPEHPFRRFGLIAKSPRAHAIVTHPFLHAGALHLGLVLLVIWLVGPMLERKLGWLTALLVGAAGAGVSALTQLATASASAAPLVGASGIAAALLGAFLVRFGRGRVQLRWVGLRAMRPMTLGRDVPGWVLLPVGLAVQLALYMLFLEGRVAAGNACAANLSALVAGGVVAFALQRLPFLERGAAGAVAPASRAKLDPRIKRATAASDHGQHDDAIALAADVLRERPDDVEALHVSWDAHVALGRAADGARSGRRLVELHARRGDLAAAARLWDELLRAAPRGRVEPTTLLRIVPELIVQARRDAAIAALRAVIDPANTALTVGQALRVAELGGELDPPSALHAARFALAHGELVDERRARLEQLVLSLENSGVRATAAPARDDATASPALPKETEHEPASDVRFHIDTNQEAAEVNLLGLPEEPSELSVEPPPPPSELFELEPTNLGGDPQSAPEASPAPVPVANWAPAALVDEGAATMLFTAEAPATSASAALKITPAIPVALDIGGLRVRLEGGAPSLIEWTRIQAIGVGLVSGLGAHPVVVIDLVLNWADAPDGALELMRLRSDAFRARQLVTGAANPLEAMRALLAELLARSGAVPLPDASGARGTPFREFASVDAYQAAVLLAAH